MINNLHHEIKLIFENGSKSLDLLDINFQIVENNIVFDTYDVNL